VSNLDGKGIDIYGLAVDLRPVLQKDLVSTWRHRGKQETVAVTLCEGAILRRKRNLAIGTGRTIEQRPHPNKPAEWGIGLRAERDDDAASYDSANGEVDERSGDRSELVGGTSLAIRKRGCGATPSAIDGDPSL
jgi:hypothetical protein